jgi:hypothetical protein
MPTLNINNNEVNFPEAYVKIGTTTGTGARLLVSGYADIWNTTNTLLRLNHDGTRSTIQSFTGGGYGVLALNDGGGNVLIGTTTDNGNKLRVQGTTWIADNVFTNGEQGIELGWTGSTINDQRIGRIRPISTPSQNPYAGGLAFDYYKYDGSSYNWFEGMRLNGAGKLGIGTATPGLKVDIVGGDTLTGTASGIFRAVQDQTNYRGVVLGYDTSGQIGIIYPETPAAASTLAIWTYTGSAWGERMRVASNGNVLIGTTTDSGNKLEVAGTLRATTGIFSIEAGFPLQVYQTNATNTTTAIIRQTTSGGNGNQDIGLLVDIQGAGDTDRIANFRYYDGSTYTSRSEERRVGKECPM